MVSRTQDTSSPFHGRKSLRYFFVQMALGALQAWVVFP